MKHALSFSSVMPFNHRGYSLKPLYSPRPDYSSSLLWYSLTWTFSTNFSFLVHLSICSLRWTWLARVMPFLVLRSLHTKSCSKRPTVLWDHELWNSWTSMFWNFKSISENHLLLFCCRCWFGLVWFVCLCFSAEEVSWVNFLITFSYIVLPKKMITYLFILLFPFGV